MLWGCLSNKWASLLGKLLENAFLLWKFNQEGKILVNCCYLCKWDTELHNHILLWCPFAHRLWSLVYGLLAPIRLLFVCLGMRLGHGVELRGIRGQTLFLWLRSGPFRKEKKRAFEGVEFMDRFIDY